MTAKDMTVEQVEKLLEAHANAIRYIVELEKELHSEGVNAHNLRIEISTRGDDLRRKDAYIAELEKENEELKTEQEILVWNLAGCSTYALGHGLNEGHNQEWERPALRDVKKLAQQFYNPNVKEPKP